MDATPRRESMHLDGNLIIQAGQSSDKGHKDVNEDCMGLRIPPDPLLTTKGIAAVIADGVSSAEAGREASESCVQSFLADYFSTPESWTVKTSGQKVLTALNRWLYGQGQSYQDAYKGYVTTLSILVAKSCTAHLFHVGDSRIYRLRDRTLEQLTHDHSRVIGKNEAYLTRAMGMDVRLDIDYRAIDLAAGDCFLLSTDGVHDFVQKAQLVDCLERAADQSQDSEALEKLCQQLIEQALTAGSHDNLTCQLLRIDGLPTEDAVDLTNKLTSLPFPPSLTPGMKIDGYRVEEEIHASSRSQVYRVVDSETGRDLAMKTPSINYEDDAAYIERFVIEPWIASRIDSPHVVKAVPNQRRQSFLYYLQEFIEGQTLEAWIAEHRRPDSSEAIDIGEAIGIIEGIAAGLRAFHRREVLHQDLKPSNVLIDRDGVVRILDFGSCFVAGINEIATPIERDHILGTASYSAPELRIGSNAGVRSEIFSLGSIAYELLTGALPYGEAINEATTARGFERLEYVPAYHHDPMIPVWLDGALQTAVRIAPARRYGELSEFLYDLRHPNPVFQGQAQLPLVERDPLKFWKGVALLLAGLNLFSWWYFLR